MFYVDGCVGEATGGSARRAKRSTNCGVKIAVIISRVMATPEDWMIIKDALSPLCEPLYRCADRSQELAELHFIQHQMHDDEHPGGRAHLARHHLRNELKKEKKNLGDWRIGAPRPNGELTLSLRAMRLRMLRPGPKVVETFPSPPPGRNRARIYYYRNPLLSLYGAAASNLVGIWAFDPEIEEVAIRIVRPVSIWRFGQYEQVDINFWLPRLGAHLSKMEFVPSDEGIVLPLFGGGLEEVEEDADSSDG